jgi:hypothetical protein
MAGADAAASLKPPLDLTEIFSRPITRHVAGDPFQ